LVIRKKSVYQCSSCNNYKSDLKNNSNEYIPWNKMSSVKDEQYRMDLVECYK